jgi:hypothetical protein
MPATRAFREAFFRGARPFGMAWPSAGFGADEPFVGPGEPGRAAPGSIRFCLRSNFSALTVFSNIAICLSFF